MWTAVALIWGLGILVLSAFMWGTQHAGLDTSEANSIRLASLEKAYHYRNRA
jgi:hypothetical protein